MPFTSVEKSRDQQIESTSEIAITRRAANDYFGGFVKREERGWMLDRVQREECSIKCKGGGNVKTVRRGNRCEDYYKDPYLLFTPTQDTRIYISTLVVLIRERRAVGCRTSGCVNYDSSRNDRSKRVATFCNL